MMYRVHGQLPAVTTTRGVKLFTRLGSSIEVSRRVAPDNELLGGHPDDTEVRMGRFFALVISLGVVMR